MRGLGNEGMQSGNPVTVYSQSITDRTKLTPTFSKQVQSVFIDRPEQEYYCGNEGML